MWRKSIEEYKVNSPPSNGSLSYGTVMVISKAQALSEKAGLANVEVPIMSFLKTVLGYRIRDRIYHAYQLFDIFKNEKLS